MRKTEPAGRSISIASSIKTSFELRAVKPVMVLALLFSTAMMLASCAKPRKLEVVYIKPEYTGTCSGVTIAQYIDPNTKKNPVALELVSEKVSVTVSKENYIDVSSDYVVKNPGKEVTVELGIPLRVVGSNPRREPDCDRYVAPVELKILVDKKPVKFQEKTITSVENVVVPKEGAGDMKTESAVHTNWMVWKQPFKAGGEHKIKLSYISRLVRTIKPRGSLSDKRLDYYQVYFISRTKRWEGTPKREVEFKLTDITPDNISAYLPDKPAVGKKSAKWTLANKDEAYLGVVFRPNIKDKNVVPYLEKRAKKEPLNPRVVRTLGIEYGKRKLDNKKRSLYSSFILKSEKKLQEGFEEDSPTETIISDTIEALGKGELVSEEKQLTSILKTALTKRIEKTSKSSSSSKWKEYRDKKLKHYRDLLAVCEKPAKG